MHVGGGRLQQKPAAHVGFPLFSFYLSPRSLSIFLFKSIFEAEFHWPEVHYFDQGSWQVNPSDFPIPTFQVLGLHHCYFTWVLGCWTGIVTLAQQALCWLAPSPSPLGVFLTETLESTFLRPSLRKVLATSGTKPFFLKMTCLQTDPLRTSQMCDKQRESYIFFFRDWRTSGNFLQQSLCWDMNWSPVSPSFSHFPAFVASTYRLLLEGLRGRGQTAIH